MSDHDSDFASVPELLSQLRDGRMIILVDDEDRENEGDLVVAAERISVEQIVQMNRLASGIITVPMPRPWLRRLHIDPMVQENAESMSTAFTVTVDASSGISTGSSAHDRATTIRKLADPTTSAEDFVRPGHINPLVVREGGVLKRPGHTEASHDLVRMAGLQPVAVLCEIMGDDGTMLRLPALRELAARLELPLGTIADVIRHRRRTEALVERVSSQELSSAFGPLQVHRYRSAVDAGRYTALVRGPLHPQQPTLVRIHAATLVDDLLGLLTGGPAGDLQLAMHRIAAEGGVLLLVERPAAVVGSADDRDYGIGAQVLAELGVRRLRLMTDHPRKRAGLHGFDLEVVEHVPLRGNPIGGSSNVVALSSASKGG
ncbi:MAG: 3,4-dihydroxy-2-butanone-4-phosphate synthase [Myxococcales bacterium]|nr:3,4-dihydroxy-2-butanone-4-phosphate synthase [Myxococcales bacterium]